MRTKLLRIALALALAMLGLIFAGQRPSEPPRLSGPYLGQEPPGDKAVLFAPGIVSTGYFEHSSPVFTPDLKEIYWSTQIHDENGRDTARPILFMRERGGIWSEPEVPSFAKAFPCAENPFIAPGGKELFFHASPTLRPERTDIYRVRRVGGGWSEPVKLAPPVNELTWNSQPSVAANGTLYFAGDYRGDSGLYYSRLAGGRYLQPVPLGDDINKRETEWTPYIAPDESYIIFCSFRPGGAGSGDLYISFKRRDGSWGGAVNMGDRINTAANERFPNVTPDGKYFFFNSTRKIPGAAANAPGNGEGDVYWIDAQVIGELRRKAFEAGYEPVNADD